VATGGAVSDKPLENLRFITELWIVETTGDHDDLLLKAMLPLIEQAYNLGYGHGYIHADSGLPRD
jgi:hypothetical protein